MRLKDLEAALQPLRRFAEANPILEQVGPEARRQC